MMMTENRKSIKASDPYLSEELFQILTVLGIIKAHSLRELKKSAMVLPF